ncbi:Holliday junction resolvase RuvX [Stenoxybacter acetivorans]|uniref:Holliday junction resolvase RuvX n=1 Tax=Stenoxybacter acetivorans TaxID=422441 RepID=UPI00068C242C|nr:Holliday junction resolvase RuvX [Stenoxybacter acetivorans]
MLNSSPDVSAYGHGSILAFDFGKVRIGVAVGEMQTKTAHPLETICAEVNSLRFERIGQLIREWQPNQLVVGLPVHLDGTEHETTALARKFGQRLHGRFSLPVYWVDERLSSVLAQSLLAEANVFGRKQKNVLDQVAAQAILHTFFDSGAIGRLPEN